MFVSLIIPTINERDALKFLFEELKETLSSTPDGYAFEIIIVDDGSDDGTPDFVKNYNNAPWPIKLIERRERGLATAVLAGMNEAKGEVFLVMDADLSHPPMLIPKMLEEIKTNDLVIGSRHVPGGGVEEWPFARKLFSRFATYLAYPLSGGVRDPLSGFFFIKNYILKDAKLNPIGYKILLEILVKCAPLKIVEIPYIFRNRSVGKSKLNLLVTRQYFRHLLRLYFHK